MNEPVRPILSNPRVEWFYRQPRLCIEIDGETARIYWEQKPTLVRLGLLYLGPEWEDRVPERSYNGTRLRGCMSDPRLMAVWSQFERFLDGETKDPTLTLPEV